MGLEHISTLDAAPKAKQVRKLISAEEHVLELKLVRKDGKGNLASAVVDLVRGTAQVRQETQPITYKSAKDVEDVIEFYSTIAQRLAEAPTPVLLTEGAEVEAADAAAE